VNISSLGCKFTIKFKVSRNSELQSFELTRIYCILKEKITAIIKYGTQKFYQKNDKTQKLLYLLVVA
jgi:hypothetical protein